jgi:hypothetical protein
MNTNTNPPPLAVPPYVLDAIRRLEAKRLGVDLEDTGVDDAYGAFWPDFCTSNIGYHGPLVVLVWAGGELDRPSVFTPEGPLGSDRGENVVTPETKWRLEDEGASLT